VNEEERKKLCETLTANIYDEKDDYDEYDALLKQLSGLDFPCKEYIVSHVERTRDDEKEHREVLEKIRMMVCPIKPSG
jgi:hypothetical protein